MLTPSGAAEEAGDVLALVTGSWRPDAPGSAPVTGCLAVLREAAGAPADRR